MNILYILDSFPKLSETFILNEIVELKERGINVEILALGRPFEFTVNEDVSSYNLWENTRYFCLPPPFNLRFSYVFSPEFYRNTYETFIYNRGADFKQTVRLSYYTPYYKDIDIVHAHFAYEAAVTGMKISNILKKPFTFTAHAFEIFGSEASSDERLKTLVDKSTRVITPSLYNKQHIIDVTKCAEDKIEIVRATIRLEKIEQIKRTETRNDKIKILAVGRLVEKKGFEYLIRAMKDVIEKHPSSFANIVGDGGLMVELRALCRDLGLSKSVNFLGAQPNEICFEELASTDIAVLPSVVASDGDMDVCPLTLQEAMAMGIPVVSTKVGSIPELIQDGVEGILVNQRESGELGRAIVKLIDDVSLRTNMGKKGKEKIENEFNIKTQVDSLLRIWKNAIKQ